MPGPIGAFHPVPITEHTDLRDENPIRKCCLYCNPGSIEKTDKIAKHAACQVEVMDSDAEPSGNAESGPTLTLRE